MGWRSRISFALGLLVSGCGQEAQPAAGGAIEHDAKASNQPQPDAIVADVEAPNDPSDASPDESPAEASVTVLEHDAFTADAVSPISAAGCPAGKYPVCLDFESGTLDAKWRMLGINMTVGTDMKAAGQYALHFSNLQPKVQQMITTTDVAAIGSVMWGRFYVHMTPGAPDGHGAFVYGYDQDNERYEVGFENNCFMGDWHGTTPRSTCERTSRFRTAGSAWSSSSTAPSPTIRASGSTALPRLTMWSLPNPDLSRSIIGLASTRAFALRTAHRSARTRATRRRW